jgi:hypothetical protein
MAQALHRRKRLAGRFRIDGGNLPREVFQRLEIPQAILGEDPQQPFAGPPDIPFAQIRRQVRDQNGQWIGDVAQAIQVFGQIRGESLFEILQAFLGGLTYRHLAQLVAKGLQTEPQFG